MHKRNSSIQEEPEETDEDSPQKEALHIDLISKGEAENAPR